jgi:hypothetical protein
MQLEMDTNNSSYLSPPQYKRPQPKERDAVLRDQVRDKLEGVRKRKYIDKGSVKSLTSYFGVPKGDRDIRMVYDATRSRLNDSLWAPGFGLPIVDSLTRGIDEQTWMGDLDIGEMFLNFCLHPELQPYAGVDLRPFGSGGATLWERWTRCLMGLKSSPYFCIKGLLIALEFVRGNRDRPSNPFSCNRLIVNLPGDSNYDPSQPKLARMDDDKLAALIITYV